MIAVDQAPHDGDALYAVGLAYAARGDNPAARRYLEAFLHAKPELETRLEVEALLASMDGLRRAYRASSSAGVYCAQFSKRNCALLSQTFWAPGFSAFGHVDLRPHAAGRDRVPEQRVEPRDAVGVGEGLAAPASATTVMPG